MSDPTALHAELAALRAENEQLRERAVAAERALAAATPPESAAGAARETADAQDEQNRAREVAEHLNEKLEAKLAQVTRAASL